MGIYRLRRGRDCVFLTGLACCHTLRANEARSNEWAGGSCLWREGSPSSLKTGSKPRATSPHPPRHCGRQGQECSGIPSGILVSEHLRFWLYRMSRFPEIPVPGSPWPCLFSGLKGSISNWPALLFCSARDFYRVFAESTPEALQASLPNPILVAWAPTVLRSFACTIPLAGRPPHSAGSAPTVHDLVKPIALSTVIGVVHDLAFIAAHDEVVTESQLWKREIRVRFELMKESFPSCLVERSSSW